MLEKNEKKCFFDAHFHLSHLKNPEFQLKAVENLNWIGCNCLLNPKDFETAEIFSSSNTIICAGIHPESANNSETSFNKHKIDNQKKLIEKLLLQKKLAAIGETGFDFFDKESRKNIDMQKSLFEYQLNLAIDEELPLIIHCRKGMDELLSYSKLLKKLPGVLFHSFMGNSRQGEEILRKEINAFFSFGKQALNNNKKVLDCIQNLPAATLLCETDAPYQTLKQETETNLTDITTIYEVFSKIREENLSDSIKNNFIRLFGEKINLHL